MSILFAFSHCTSPSLLAARFVLASRVVLSHISPGALDSVLKRIADVAEQLLWLEQRLDAIQSAKRLGGVLHAFAACATEAH